MSASSGTPQRILGRKTIPSDHNFKLLDYHIFRNPARILKCGNLKGVTVYYSRLRKLWTLDTMSASNSSGNPFSHLQVDSALVLCLTLGNGGHPSSMTITSLNSLIAGTSKAKISVSLTSRVGRGNLIQGVICTKPSLRKLTTTSFRFASKCRVKEVKRELNAML